MPTPEKMKELRARHGISREELALSLYGIKPDRVTDWELGRRNCPPIVWWAMVLTWDKKDLRE